MSAALQLVRQVSCNESKRCATHQEVASAEAYRLVVAANDRAIHTVCELVDVLCQNTRL